MAEGVLGDTVLARAAWAEVSLAHPADVEALERREDLARLQGDGAEWEKLLRARLRRHPTGTPAREGWLTLSQYLDQQGRPDEALVALEDAARAEPGHHALWQQLAQRYVRQGALEKAVMAFDHAATSTPDEIQRNSEWSQLATFVREQVGDEKRAAAFEARAVTLGRLSRSRGVTDPEIPFQRHDTDEVPAAPTEFFEITVDFHDPVDSQAVLVGPEFLEVITGETDAPIPPRKPTLARPSLFAELKQRPLEAPLYRALVLHFRDVHDGPRARLMQEIADALEHPPVRPPPPPVTLCSATDRAGLRHPSLRTPFGDLLGLAGLALCRLFAQEAGEARDELRIDSGKGAQGVADALVAGVRTLGLRCPPALISRDPGPPICLVHEDEPRILIGRTAVKTPMPIAELRFFAGRSLFLQLGDVLVLKMLSRT